ncbi:hypothetical protein SAMN04488039_103277 [Sulfitobacter dubius]|nr:hypothetical protein SAMN04488039_103277 [Sulfitobacter dubius]
MSFNSTKVIPQKFSIFKNRLSHCTNLTLPEAERAALVKELMQARLAVKNAKTNEDVKTAQGKVHEAKVALGERGPVWWNDGAPDVNRHHPKNRLQAVWWRGLAQD